MKISVDGGALCAHDNNKYGNYRFSYDLITSFDKYDLKNSYKIYTFCNNPLLLHNILIGYKVIKPSVAFMSLRVGIEELINKTDLFLALNQAIPAFVASRIFSFSHGLAFHFYPRFYLEAHNKLQNQLKTMLNKSHRIFVSSIRVKNEFAKIFPSFKNVTTLPFGINEDLINNSFVPNREKTILYVGMDHPIKRIDLIIKSFLNATKKTNQKDWQLKLIGVSKEYENAGQSIKVVPCVDRDSLIKIYKKSSLLITASVYESFNLPVLEALCCDVPVIGLESAIIPEFKKYANIAISENDFENQIAKFIYGSLNKRDKIDKMIFSWNRYVKILMSYY